MVFLIFISVAIIGSPFLEKYDLLPWLTGAWKFSFLIMFIALVAGVIEKVINRKADEILKAINDSNVK